jgi:hypothetical protein
MSWANAISDLRTVLSDGPTDKLRAFKSIFGRQDGINTVFKTFEFRRVTDFAASGIAAPFGIYIDGVRLAASGIASDDPQTGYFTLSAAPTDANRVEATYYLQWFTDAELDSFMIRSANWLGLGDDYTEIVSGLKASALKFALYEAYTKLALRFAENIVETYRLQDAPDEKRMEIVKAYQDAASKSLDDATALRDDFYKRKGKSYAPLYGTVSGNIRNPTIG